MPYEVTREYLAEIKQLLVRSPASYTVEEYNKWQWFLLTPEGQEFARTGRVPEFPHYKPTRRERRAQRKR